MDAEHVGPAAHWESFDVTSEFVKKLRSGEFVIAVELDPPSTSDISKLVTAAKILKNAGTDIVTISDSPLARTRLDSVICSLMLRQQIGVEVLPHVCCRDRNSIALRSALLGAHCAGMRAILAVTGDRIAKADQGKIKPVFELNSFALMETVQQMNRDVFTDSPMMCGGALNPSARNRTALLERVRKKVDRGCEFFLTQPVFDPKQAELLDDIRRLGVRILAGVMPLVSYRNAMYMATEVPGIRIPKEILSRFSPDMSREEAAETGIAVASELAQMLLPFSDGFYFLTPFNRAEIIKEVLWRVFPNRGS